MSSCTMEITKPLSLSAIKSAISGREVTVTGRIETLHHSSSYAAEITTKLEDYESLLAYVKLYEPDVYADYMLNFKQEGTI